MCEPLLFVFGNHELTHLPRYRSGGLSHTSFGEDYSAPSFGSIYVGERVRRIKGIIVAGLGGCPVYNRGPNQFSEGAMRRKILRLVPRLIFNRIVFGRYLDVFLTHAPAHCINDRSDQCHRGFKSFLWFLRKFKPKFMVHGHVHLYDRNAPRSTRYFETEIVNAYDHTVLEL
jgi:Icc-related predicted phosphoesterase